MPSKNDSPTPPIPAHAACPTSPTGAHWRKCTHQFDQAKGHNHEMQICQHCGDTKQTPCWLCGDSQITYTMPQHRAKPKPQQA